ncbi:MAG: hypothetical protein JW861_07775, partial [Bacteroidales bacterium]|nr:hypothetical protein [Bacteroidales bacterium]
SACPTIYLPSWRKAGRRHDRQAKQNLTDQHISDDKCLNFKTDEIRQFKFANLVSVSIEMQGMSGLVNNNMVWPPLFCSDQKVYENRQI